MTSHSNVINSFGQKGSIKLIYILKNGHTISRTHTRRNEVIGNLRDRKNVVVKLH